MLSHFVPVSCFLLPTREELSLNYINQFVFVFGNAVAVISVLAVVMIIVIVGCFLYWRTSARCKKPGKKCPPQRFMNFSFMN